MSNYTNISGKLIPLATNTLRSLPFLGVALGMIKFIAKILPEETKKKVNKKVEESLEEIAITHKYNKESIFKWDTIFISGLSILVPSVMWSMEILRIKSVKLNAGDKRTMLIFTGIWTASGLLIILPAKLLHNFLTHKTKFRQLYVMETQNELNDKRRLQINTIRDEKKKTRALEVVESKRTKSNLRDLETEDKNLIKELMVNSFVIRYMDYNNWDRELICPLRRSVFLMPVIAEDDQTYDLETLASWWLEGHDCCPYNPSVLLTNPYQLPINMDIARKIFDVIKDHQMFVATDVVQAGGLRER